MGSDFEWRMKYGGLYDWSYRYLIEHLEWGKTKNFLELGRREEIARMAVEYIALFTEMHPDKHKTAKKAAIEVEGMFRFERYHRAKQ